jgi:hypothetical protein
MRDRLLKWPFTDQKTGVTCAIITTRMVGSTFLKTLLLQSGMSLTFFYTFWEQDKAHSNNSHALDDLKQIINKIITAQNLLGCTAVFLNEFRPTFKRCVLSPSTGRPDDGGSTYL